MYKLKKDKPSLLMEAQYLMDYTFQMTDNTDRYSKRRRFTFVDRIQNMVLDVYLDLSRVIKFPIQEQYEPLTEIALQVESLLVLIEISLTRNFINHGECERWASKAIKVIDLINEILK